MRRKLPVKDKNKFHTSDIGLTKYQRYFLYEETIPDEILAALQVKQGLKRIKNKTTK